jgi:hypothetical protein
VTTRSELRAALRLRLEDDGLAPLWDDFTLDDMLAAAIRTYGAAFPRQVTTGVTVPAGATRVTTGTTIEPGRIARITDAAGIWVAPWPAGEERCGERGQAWRWWGDELILAEPAAASGAGIWTVEHLAGRLPPTSDEEAVDLLPGDEEIALAYAEAAALARRAVEDAKRGAPSDAGARADAARRTAAALGARRKRRVRSGVMG